MSDVELPERGTRIVLHLKEGDHEFADQYRIRSLVRKYSDHIAFPVRMPKPAPYKAEDEEKDEAKTDDSVVAEVAKESRQRRVRNRQSRARRCGRGRALS